MCVFLSLLKYFDLEMLPHRGFCQSNSHSPHGENALNLLPPWWWAWQRSWGTASPLQGGNPLRRSLSRRSHLQRQGEPGVLQI